MKHYTLKSLLFVILVFTFSNCRTVMNTGTATIIRPQDVVSMEFERFDIERFEREKNPISQQLIEVYTKEDGTVVDIFGSHRGFSITILPPSPYFYRVEKWFFPNGKIEAKGILLPGNFRIGKWLECDEEGNCEVIDHDAGIGFTYYQVLRFLEKRGYIDLRTGKGRWAQDQFNFTMWFNREQNQWVVRASKGVRGTKYILHGSSGRIISEEVLPPLH